MRVAVLVVSRNRPDLVQNLAGWLERNMTYEHDLIVVEAGTEEEQISEFATIHYEDADFRGKCFAHNVAMEHARAKGAIEKPYDYYWVLMNDLVFDEGVDAARILIETMEADPRLGILSPTCKDKIYPGSARKSEGGWHPVTTCDYLGFMISSKAVEDVGFLNPNFKYCWGAIHELSYKLYNAGMIVAYSDDVEYEHLGGSTYGAKGTNTISREEYQVRAKQFAFDYFLHNYGSSWPTDFWAATKDHNIEVNTFADHCKMWSTGFTQEELRETIAREKAAPPKNTKKPMQNTDQAQQGPLRLHLGCGPDRREGWVNVDVNPKFNPDLVAHAHDLPMLPDSSCSDIESCHLFEHLTLTQARAALREWRRLIMPGGQLHLELPNLERCLALVGTEMNGFDLGMISLFGYPPEIDEQGEPQLHKWGWTPETLAEELYKAGFQNVEQVPITQTHRPAAKFDRDMRLVATVAAPVAAPAPTPEPAACLPAEPNEKQQVLAWPRYENQAELDQFFHIFARVLSGREDVNLNLRIDPKLDPNRNEVIAAIDASHARILGGETVLNVTLLEGEISPEQWRDLSSQVTCRIRSSNEAAPRDAACQVATPVVSDAPSLYSVINGGDSCASTPTTPAATSSNTSTAQLMSTPDTQIEPQSIDGMGVLVTPGAHPDHNLVKSIHALHPWFYPVTFKDMTVVPGLGSVCDPDWLTNRAACRSTLLVEQVLRRIDFRGKSVLDLACNCGFWSSFYAQAGASSVLGMEGRSQHVEQARLYWESNGFLPQGKAEFFQGNISDESDWQTVRAKGPFDVTLCAGILYHIPNYAEVLAWAAAMTNEVLIVDTRVQDGAEDLITEPGDLTFNAIAETREKIVPDRQRLLETLRQLGFEAQVMPVGFASELGVDNVDSYSEGARVTIVARKLPVGVHTNSQIPLSTPQ